MSEAALRDGRLGGIAFGIVSQNQDPEGLGRVRVRLPWLDGHDVDESTWATLAAPMEGKEYGWYALPDIGDQVAIAFIGGDLRQPVVLGGAWNASDAPPEINEDGKNHFRGYRSRAGHRLIFDDSDQAKVAFVEQGGQQTIGVGKLAGAGGSSPNAVDVYRPGGAGDQGVAIASMDGALEVSCPDGTLTIDAGTDVTIRSASTLAVKVGGTLTAKGGTIEVTASATAAFQGSNVKVA